MKRDSGAAVAYLLAACSVGFVLAGALLGPACTHAPPVLSPPDVMVPPVADAAPEPDAPPSDDCAADCRAWRAQGCSEGNPTAAGATCEAVCRNLADAGIDSAHQLSCATSATATCATHRACPY